MHTSLSSIYKDLEIIHIIRENEPAKKNAENQLFARYVYFIEEGKKKYSLSEEDAFTAYSDTILTILNNVRNSNFESRSSLKTYLYKIYHHKCVDLIRKNTTNKRSIHETAPISDMLEMVGDKAKNALQKLIEKNDQNLLKMRLNELGEKCRKMLLFFADGFKDKDIAVFMDYKAAEVVKTTRLRCLDKLRMLYNKNINTHE